MVPNTQLVSQMFDDFIKCDSNAEYIAEFNKLFTGEYIAQAVDITEEYTDTHGNALAVAVFTVKEV